MLRLLPTLTARHLYRTVVLQLKKVKVTSFTHEVA